MPRPRSLTDAQIAEAALAVVDRGGVGALSMRAIAAELGMATMAVYRYVVSREQLETHLVDLVLGAADTGHPASDLPWDQRVTALLGRIRAAVAAHPRAAPLVLARWHACDGARRQAEALHRVLAEAGITGRRRETVHRALMAYLVGVIHLETRAEAAQPDPAPPGPLPPDPVPPDSAPYRTGEEVFHDGLAALLRGFATGRTDERVPPGPA